ncbi:hypothetical protein MPSEU_000232600 [Mayamaea pseudoterrestris]|nr:hypothetical protein MPSEU_000232600 [Mayamaea pseudoterrestris]
MASPVAANNTTLISSSSSSSIEPDTRLAFVRRYYQRKGYRVHSGLQFGCEFVLYADDPSKVHSDFCVHVVNENGILDWRRIQVLARSMPSLHKTLILAYIKKTTADATANANNNNDDDDDNFTVEELAIGTEHAPFRHKKQAFIQDPGEQQKKRKVNEEIVNVGQDDDDASVASRGGEYSKLVRGGF